MHERPARAGRRARADAVHGRRDPGRPTGDVVRERATWLDLQDHAAFPADSTTVAAERIRLAFGDRDCLRYDVVGEAGTNRFWFALAHPGMPVGYELPGLSAEAVTIG